MKLHLFLFLILIINFCYSYDIENSDRPDTVTQPGLSQGGDMPVEESECEGDSKSTVIQKETTVIPIANVTLTTHLSSTSRSTNPTVPPIATKTTTVLQPRPPQDVLATTVPPVQTTVIRVRPTAPQNGNNGGAPINFDPESITTTTVVPEFRKVKRDVEEKETHRQKFVQPESKMVKKRVGSTVAPI